MDESHDRDDLSDDDGAVEPTEGDEASVSRRRRRGLAGRSRGMADPPGEGPTADDATGITGDPDEAD